MIDLLLVVVGAVVWLLVVASAALGDRMDSHDVELVDGPAWVPVCGPVGAGGGWQ